MLYNIFILSDGTGRTAQQALNSALLQFEENNVKTLVYPGIRTKEQIVSIFKEVKEKKGLVVHTIVSKHLRELILQQGRLHEIGTIDIMGPLLAQLSHNFDNLPIEKPGIFEVINKAYFQRIEAVEFTLRHDDGLRFEELGLADVVLLGVSRTFKTPISVYMAHKGWSVANVPVVLGMPLPETVYKIDPKRVFCLNTSASRLAELRKIRHHHLGGQTGDYSSYQYVRDELNYAHQLYRLQSEWTIINVTFKPIEEISSEIITHIRDRYNVAD